MVLEVCQELGREFLGCDLTYQAMEEFKMKKLSLHTSKVCLNCWELL